MKQEEKEFISGTYKINFHQKDFEYKSFLPQIINQDYTWNNPLISGFCRI